MTKSGSHQIRTFGVISLCSPPTVERFEAGCDYLTQLGFAIKKVLDPCKAEVAFGHRFSAFSEAELADAYHSLVVDSEVDAVICARGGSGGLGVLAHLDFELLKKHRKPFIGFSDATNFLTALSQHDAAYCIHGPMLAVSPAWASSSSAAKESVDSLLTLMNGQAEEIFGSAALVPFGSVDGTSLEVTGKLSGGNLAILTSMIGTPWQANFDDAIVVLEEVGEPPYRVRRMFQQHAAAGSFRKARAILFGQFLSEEEGVFPELLKQFAIQSFGDLGIPLFSGVPVGHADPNLAFPIGSEASMKNGVLKL